MKCANTISPYVYFKGKMKLVIATCPGYDSALVHFLKSLDYMEHLEDIIVSVSNVAETDSMREAERYKSDFGLKHVITYHTNIFEYTAFAALGKALTEGRFAEDKWFFMLHDTMEVGGRFWRECEGIEAVCEGSREVFTKVEGSGKDDEMVVQTSEMATAVMSVPYGMKKKVVCNKFVCTDDALLRARDMNIATAKPLYLGMHYQLVDNLEKAYRYKDGSGGDDYVNWWFPIVNNFNIGVAHRDFIKDVVYPVYKDAVFDKIEGINRELNVYNPHNIKNLAGAGWKYVYPDNTQFFSTWQNDTDVYGTGKKRCVAYIHPIDAKKFVYFLDIKKESTHQSV